MKDRIFLVIIPLFITACIMVLVGINVFGEPESKESIPVFAGVIPILTILGFCTLYYTLNQWRTLDGNNLHLPLILFLNILYIPFYYIRIKKIRDGRQKVSLQLKKPTHRWVKSSLLKISLLGDLIYITYVVLSMFRVLHGFGYPSLIVHYSLTLLFLSSWIYYIYCWSAEDRKAKYLWLLILFNVFYLPFYYFRISKILYKIRNQINESSRTAV